MFSCEFCEISKNTFSYRTPPMAASVFPSRRSTYIGLLYEIFVVICFCFKPVRFLIVSMWREDWLLKNQLKATKDFFQIRLKPCSDYENMIALFVFGFILFFFPFATTQNRFEVESLLYINNLIL